MSVNRPLLSGRAGTPERAKALAEAHEGIEWDPAAGDTILVTTWTGLLRLMSGHNARDAWGQTIIRPDDGDEIVLSPVAPDTLLPVTEEP